MWDVEEVSIGAAGETRLERLQRSGRLSSSFAVAADAKHPSKSEEKKFFHKVSEILDQCNDRNG